MTIEQIYCSNLNLHIAIDRIKKDGEETSRWYKTNFLQGNYSKYQAMAIARDTQQMELVIDDCRINFTDAFKLLGVIIDRLEFLAAYIRGLHKDQ